MKCLSLTQPWATLVVTGEKKVETRSWQTSFRGMIAIQAAKGFPRWAKELVTADVFEEALRKHGYRSAGSLPLGAIIGAAELIDCIPTGLIECDLKAVSSYDVEPVQPGDPIYKITEKEKTFGDYGPNRYALDFRALDTAQNSHSIQRRARFV